MTSCSKAPERIWTCNETKNIWISDEQEDTTEYIRADTVTALQAEVDRLREALRDIAEPKVGPDVDWSKEEANAWRAGRWRWAQSRARAALSGDDI